MILTRFNKNVNYHQSNPDKPNMSAEELKRLFDQGVIDLKDYINNILLPEIEKQTTDDLKKRYHVGKIVIDTSNTNPYTYLGFGNWEYIGQGKTLIGVDESDPDFNTVEQTGGEKTHKSTIEEMPYHEHDLPGAVKYYKEGGPVRWTTDGQYDKTAGETRKTAGAGGNKPFNIVQPYITVFFWKRIS